ncbi:TetR/AcrR family transcriptional regulator [Haloglycomyces albus]|uniref:TetR/AcrR family transcriptional regulator n=1 Tax=Haloglycomyces albus TaxID=526067 RepID=UPI00046CB8AD|nr:TetR/AcrR family transcriptional regulator [Haloglycomyces albus]
MSDRYHHGSLREELIRSAVELIDETGTAAVSLRAVATLAGVSHAAPAHHFHNKAGLLTAVATQGYSAFADRLAQAWERTGSLATLGATYLRFGLAHRAYMETMFRPELLNNDDMELIAARNRARALLDRGAADGEHAARSRFEPGDDFSQVRSIAAWSLVHGLTDLIRTGNLPASYADAPEETIRRLTESLAELGHVPTD